MASDDFFGFFQQVVLGRLVGQLNVVFSAIGTDSDGLGSLDRELLQLETINLLV